jgi:hypothetical protein
MKANSQRPLAVWIALGILIVYVPLLFLGVVFLPDESVLDERDFADLIIDTAEVGAVSLSLIIAFWALATRRQWGRWFVAAALPYIIGVSLWGQLFSPDVDVNEEIEVLLLGAIVLLSPLVIIILLVSVGSRVKSYFSMSEQSSQGLVHET